MILTLGKAMPNNPKAHPVRKPVGGRHPHMQVYWEVDQIKSDQPLRFACPDCGRQQWVNDLLWEKYKCKNCGAVIHQSDLAWRGDKGKSHPQWRSKVAAPKKPAAKKVPRLKGRNPHAAARASEEARKKVAMLVLMDRAKKAREKPVSYDRHAKVLEKLVAAERQRGLIPHADLNAIMDYAAGHMATADVRQFAADPSSNLNEFLKDEEMRSALALMAGNADAMMLTPNQVKKMQAVGIIDDSRALNDFGIQIVATFRQWLERQSANLMNLVGSGETKRAEYYVPEELALAEHAIRSKVALGKSEKGVQFTYRLKIAKGNKTFTAIYKPAEGEADQRPGAIDPGTAYRRERAAYEIDQLFGLGIVPPCVIRNVGGKPGSVQEWVNGETAFEAGDDSWKDEADPEELKSMAFLDYITMNTDRHTGNFMVDTHSGRPENKLWAIDHGYAFPHDADLGAAYYLSRPHQFCGERHNLAISKPLLARLKKIDPNHLKAKLQRLGIEETAIAGVIARFNQVVITKTLPKYSGRDMW